MSCGVGRRCGSDPVLLWLERRLEATAWIRPLAWEPPYAAEAALEMAKRKKEREVKTFQFQREKTLCEKNKNKLNRGHMAC